MELHPNIRDLTLSILFGAFITVALYFGMSNGTVNTYIESHLSQTKPLSGSVLKILVPGGHGSGIHIGNGYVVTAAHVVTDNQTVAYQRDDGKKGKLTVLWVDYAHDVAMTVMETYDEVSTSNLSCTIPKTGDSVTLIGNPLFLDNITTWGKVAGSEREVGPWAEGVPVDVSVGAGMSGGGTFDKHGNLVGIIVGMTLQPMGFGATAVGISIIVPGRTICNAMERH